MMHRPATDRMRQPALLPWVILSAAIVASLLAEDWIAGVAILVLCAGWYFLKPQVGPPVLAVAFSFQWIQVVAGTFYYAFTGRLLPPMYEADCRPMVLIGLGCLVALLAGLKLGMRILRMTPGEATEQAFSWLTLIQLYIASIALTGVLKRWAWEIPQLTQPVYVLTFARFGLLYLILRRLTRPRARWGWITVILAGEISLGFTGYFAEFREALIIAALAVLEVFNRRQLSHWVGMAGMVGLIFLTGLLWVSIKGEYRGEIESGVLSSSRLERLDRIGSLTSRWMDTGLASAWGDVDSLVNRLWAVYYPALAIQRVPAVLPHQNGALLWGAIRHVLMPRLIFPDKSAPASDSEMVRRYAGVWVAGPEQGTSIAFGYAAESYVDFGLPWMFLPVFVYGVLMGFAYHGFFRVVRQRELAVGAVTIVFWVSLFLFERSWLRMLGFSGTMIVYLGGVVILLDRYLQSRARRRGVALRRARMEHGL